MDGLYKSFLTDSQPVTMLKMHASDDTQKHAKVCEMLCTVMCILVDLYGFLKADIFVYWCCCYQIFCVCCVFLNIQQHLLFTLNFTLTPLKSRLMKLFLAELAAPEEALLQVL